MRSAPPHILLVNPWIYDFAAYDVWAKPYGLLLLAGMLRYNGFPVSYMDCLDRFHPRAKPADPAARNGRGPYLKTRISKPDGLEDVARNYSRYGICPEWFREDLFHMPRPELILVTSLMTYWYPGVTAAVRELRTAFPDVPIILGGIYATLCPDHARQTTGADAVITGNAYERIFSIIEEFTGYASEPRFDPAEPDAWPWPAFDLQSRIGYVPLLTSLGCPYSCAYCASNRLQPLRILRSPESVFREVRHWQKNFGVTNFVFYDDALLVNARSHAMPLFEQLIESGMTFQFHTPNAVHIREITKETTSLMAQAGVVTLRLGLESLDFKNRHMDQKFKREEFFRAAACLREAGFKGDRMGAYLLVGLPGQDMAAVEADIRMVKQNGIKPILAYYSPIPHTAMWPAAVRASRYNLEADPIYTNNAVFPCQPAFNWKQLSRLKQMAAE